MVTYFKSSGRPISFSRFSIVGKKRRARFIHKITWASLLRARRNSRVQVFPNPSVLDRNPLSAEKHVGREFKGRNGRPGLKGSQSLVQDSEFPLLSGPLRIAGRKGMPPSPSIFSPVHSPSPKAGPEPFPYLVPGGQAGPWPSLQPKPPHTNENDLLNDAHVIPLQEGVYFKIFSYYHNLPLRFKPLSCPVSASFTRSGML